jgi:pimeloyl-ACP methyl ester carboxylesterase
MFVSRVVLLLAPLAVAAQVPVPQANGLWEGAINLPSGTLEVVVRLDRAAAGEWSGTIDIPAQAAKGAALADIAIDGRSVRFSIAGVPGNPTFAGTLSDDGATIGGDFTQGPGKLTFTLRRNTTGTPTVVAAPRPQEPKPPYPYNDDEVTIQNSAAGVRLAGTLTTPRTGGGYPVVILITGSGQQDRNETVFGHKPFLVLADYLTRRGIAVLRMDDRGIGGTTGNPALATSEDSAGDVLAAIEFLKTYASTNRSRIGLIGHSEGGLIAPMVATRSKDVAFEVLLAGSGVTGEQILYEQAATLAQAQGATADEIAQGRARQERLYGVLKSETDVAVMRERIRAINGDASARALTSPWFRFFVTYDPAPALRTVKIPTLALNGEKDVQVPFKQNLPAIEAALKAGGNTDVTVRSFPNLNHLFQTSRTGLPGEYAQIEETMAPVVLETIADWILARAK